MNSAGGIILGTSDSTSPWNQARAYASSIDYSSLLITVPPDPDLYSTSGGESIHFSETLSVSPTAIFVSRTDAGGGLDDDNPSVLYFPSMDTATNIPVATPSNPTPSQSAFSACIVGWPATYTCPDGFLWVAPLYTCVPCRPGFFYVGGTKKCVPCPIGSYSALEGSTGCLPCPYARAVGLSQCTILNSSTTLPPSCLVGYEMRGSSCLPCIPGFAKNNSGPVCLPCAPGQYSNAAARTSCSSCPRPFVSTQWGSSGCIPCASGYVAAPGGDACNACVAGLQYFFNSKPYAMCLNKTVLSCQRGFFLEDGGSNADNRCVACAGCGEGQIMVPFQLNPCGSYAQTKTLGAPYTCISVVTLAGQFSRLSLVGTAFQVQYTPCQGLPAYASWAVGPHPSICFFQCNYAISGPVSRQYLLYYGMEHPDAFTQYVLGLIGPNTYPLEYPGLDVGLMLMSNQVCMPCPNTQCGWGLWRPIMMMNNECGPPVCVNSSAVCQIMEAGPVVYKSDGCIMACSVPSNGHLVGLAPIGMGDSCPWKCNFGYFLDLVVVDRDQNETGFICSECSPTVCQSGIERYDNSLCLPENQKKDFCLPCPVASALSVLTSGPKGSGLCQYSCLANISYQSSLTQECLPCPNVGVFCPSGYRRVCAENPCAPCPSLPSALWSSALAMPSKSSVCQAACRDGYITMDASTDLALKPPLAISYDATKIHCVLCSSRPDLPCPSLMQICPPGYYFTVGTGTCSKCVSVYDCGLGMFPSGCVCAQCATPSFSGMAPILQIQADGLAQRIGVLQAQAIVSGYGSCPMVCPVNSILMAFPNKSSTCIQCSQFNTVNFNTYAVWNASNGSRWWPAEQDPPFLPPRAAGSERRAGLCWPCPVGTKTSIGDTDLCLTVDNKATTTITSGTVFAPMMDSGHMFIFSGNSRPILRPRLNVTSNRKLLGDTLPSRIICPEFTSGPPECKCNPGFTMVAPGKCVASKKMERARLQMDGASLSLKAVATQSRCSHGKTKDKFGNCRRKDYRKTGLDTGMFSQGCGPGYQQSTVIIIMCEICKKGTFSSSHGFGPCIACPDSRMTTMQEGSISSAQCIVQREADILFSK